MTGKICSCCGQLTGNAEYDRELHDMYSRMKSGKQNAEPLVFTQADREEMNWDYDDEARETLNYVMERDMASRGMCPMCGRPDLRGLSNDDFISEKDLHEMQEMWAVEAAERRAGC